MFITSKIRLSIQKAKGNATQILSRYLNFASQKLIFGNLNFIQYLALNHHSSFAKKQAFLKSIDDKCKVVFFVFRDLHLTDWFLPIHRSLGEKYSGRIAVLYVNFGSTLKKVGSGIEYLSYLNAIEKRISVITDACYQHFSDQEISLFTSFPQPDIIITSENIRKENFVAGQRVYLPHYSVPKANDTLPAKIKYNHVFLPTKPEFSYDSLKTPGREGVQLHEIGYPKILPVKPKKIRLFDNSNPVVVFAPSLNISLIESVIKQGILTVFRNIDGVNVILKLHPTLSSKMHYLNDYLQKELKDHPTIAVDTKTSIQELGDCSTLLITDFGSTGAEYRLGFGKRVIYLKVPSSFEGGADLFFRDQFADAVVSVKALKNSILELLKMGHLTEIETAIMRERVLYNWQIADQLAADKIGQILFDL